MSQGYTLPPEGAHVRVKADAKMEDSRVLGKTAKYIGFRALKEGGGYAQLELDEPIDHFRFWLVHPENLEPAPDEMLPVDVTCDGR